MQSKGVVFKKSIKSRLGLFRWSREWQFPLPVCRYHNNDVRGEGEEGALIIITIFDAERHPASQSVSLFHIYHFALTYNDVVDVDGGDGFLFR